VDILSRNTTWTFTRDASLGLSFVGINYFDGQGFMVTKKRGVKNAKQLDGATVCVQPGTTTELNLADYFRANSIKFKPVVIEKFEEVLAAYFAGRCDVFTTDVSGLVAGTGIARGQCQRPYHSSRGNFQRAVWSPRCATATITGSISSNGRSTR
jgi:ABC-type amino acid transport substrate-binding protein